MGINLRSTIASNSGAYVVVFARSFMSDPDKVWMDWYGRDTGRNEYCLGANNQIKVQIESHSNEVDQYVKVYIFYLLFIRTKVSKIQRTIE